MISDFQYGFSSSRSTANLLTVVPDRIARAFNATGSVALDISEAFDRIWYASSSQTFSLMEFLIRYYPYFVFSQ